MKVWVKLVIGACLGIIIGFLMPDNPSVYAAFDWLKEFALGIGRYAVVPVLVFSLTIAVYELRSDDQFWQFVFRHFMLIVAASFFVIFLGIITTTIFLPHDNESRIPIQPEAVQAVENIDPAANLTEIFPSNMFSILGGDGIYLFPVCVLAFFLGMGLNYDRNYSKPVISLIDSLSRIFYHVASFFSEILGFILIVLAAYWAIRFSGVPQAKGFTNLIILLGVFSVVLCFGIMPLFLYLLKPKVNPWRILYGFLGPAITAFFSGDINFTIPVLQRHSKENFGIRRRSSSISIVLFSTFCRGGSAMVAAIAFIVLIKSNSHLQISFVDLFSIGFRAYIISFLLARHPGGAFIALTALCFSYGSGEYESWYLNLKSVSFYLIAVGTFIDIMLNAFGSYILARTNGYIDEKNLVHFI